MAQSYLSNEGKEKIREQVQSIAKKEDFQRQVIHILLDASKQPDTKLTEIADKVLDGLDSEFKESDIKDHTLQIILEELEHIMENEKTSLDSATLNRYETATEELRQIEEKISRINVAYRQNDDKDEQEKEHDYFEEEKTKKPEEILVKKIKRSLEKDCNLLVKTELHRVLEHNQTTQEYNRLVENAATKKADLEKQQIEKNKKQEAHNKVNQETNNLKNKYNQAQETVKEKVKLVQDAKTKIASLNTSKRNLEKEIEQLEEAKTKTNNPAEIKRIEDKIAKQRNKIDSAEEQIDTAKQSLKELNKDVKKAEKETSELQARLTEASIILDESNKKMQEKLLQAQ